MFLRPAGEIGVARARSCCRESDILGRAVDCKVDVGPLVMRVRVPGAGRLFSPGEQIAIQLPSSLHVLRSEGLAPDRP